ncbi:hypothetical protein M5X00_06310 [Paenibacillus alvei]|uniref:hypothetical protein n=2 Tax=Paenibacillus alvei TaxID=44250 RepID=UPI000288D928|nr:hypothetical protein [Paenibacillus alvei]EJW14881.1 hypothetical protein PAV_11c02220 [Paenibacillus alvei DSM 29]MCY9708400.1 hypothetical protein [Paenibacillus alvei]MCY9732274.1 hypothetical protein [Paenibacillus alvei]MCY9753869.1 hypothetical protein [Paenibacillus alvei]MCY9769434.1 hypothetical protein [Paenibacillus alvei]
MLSTISYIILSVFDALAVVALTTKLYRLPLRTFFIRIICLAACIAFVSFGMREMLGLPAFDLPLQYIIYVLFFRYAMGMKLHLSSFVVGSGLTGYISIQMIFYAILLMLKAGQHDLIQQVEGLAIYIIQVGSILIAYLIAIIFKVKRYGFSFILEPPHDFLIRDDFSEYSNKVSLISALISIITITVIFWIMLTKNHIASMILCVVTFIISYYFSARSDFEDVRKALTTTRRKNRGE